MVSFQHRLSAGLKARNVNVCCDLADAPYQAVLVIGGTRHLGGLWRARKRGIPIVQRLDGMNWLHRLRGVRGSGLRHFLRAEYGNLALRLIRARLASYVVYQSHFVHRWWERTHGATPVPSKVIHNGVDLNIYTPNGPGAPPQDRWRILMVEGNLMGGYEQGLLTAVQFVQRLAFHLAEPPHRHLLATPLRPSPPRLELMIVGRLASALREHCESRLAGGEYSSNVSFTWAGQVPEERIPEIDRSAHLLYSADLNPACPNSVIEAMACGLPVISFDTGALPELVVGDAGRVVPYGGNPWRLDQPNVDALARTAVEMLSDLKRFRRAARTRAEAAFGLDNMVGAYLDILLDS